MLTRKQRREQERQQRKKQIKKAQSLGLKKTESKLLHSPATSKEQKKKRKNIEKKYNYQYLRSIGYTTQEAKRFQGSSKNTIENLSRTLATPLQKKQLEANAKAAEAAKKREAKKKEESTRSKLIIFWQDLVEFGNQHSVKTQKHQFKYLNTEALEQSAIGLAQLRFGESPASLYGIEWAINPKQAKDYNAIRGFNTVYEGYATDYRKLLIAINTMFVLVYDPNQKKDFFLDLINAIRPVNPKIARRLLRLRIA